MFTMSAQLPTDVLHLICEQLRDQSEFNTLFHCAVAAKQLAVASLPNLYRQVDPEIG